jgi:uncharacterized membrane protein YvbJ
MKHMKTCPKCWEDYPDAETVCKRCKKRLVPGVMKPHEPHKSHTDRLVRQKLKGVMMQTLVILGIIFAVFLVTLYIFIKALA